MKLWIIYRLSSYTIFVELENTDAKFMLIHGYTDTSIQMKKTKLMLIVIAFITITSCQKEALETPLVKQQFIAGVIVKDGALHFESPDDFFDKMYEIQRMPNTQYDELVLKSGFKSYRTKLNADQAQKTAEIDAWVDSVLVVNPDLLMTNGDPYADEIIVPEIQSDLYRSIVDENGVFYVDGAKNVVDGTSVSGYTVSNTKSEGVLIGKTSYVINEETRSYIPSYRKVKYTCNKRYIVASAQKFYMSRYASNGSLVKYAFEIVTEAEKHSFWGGWRAYNTRHILTNISFEGLTYPDQSNGDYNKVTLAFAAPYYWFSCKDNFVNARILFRFSSRGTSEHGYGIYDTDHITPHQYIDAC